MPVSIPVSHNTHIYKLAVRNKLDWTTQSTLLERGLFAFGCKSINHAFTEFETFGVHTKLNNFGNLLTCITICFHNQTTRNDEMEAMQDSSVRHTGLEGW